MTTILSIILIAITAGTVINDLSKNYGYRASTIPNCEAIGSCIATIICIKMAFDGTLTGVNIPLAIAITVAFVVIIVVTVMFCDFEYEGYAVVVATAINMIAIIIAMFASALTPA